MSPKERESALDAQGWRVVSIKNGVRTYDKPVSPEMARRMREAGRHSTRIFSSGAVAVLHRLLDQRERKN